MKKILAALVLAFFVALSTVAFFGGSVAKIVNAEEAGTTETTETTETPTEEETTKNEGENLPTTGETTTDEETPTEDGNAPTTGEEQTPTFTLTQEELTEIINSALTEQQKEIVNSLSGKIASALGIDHNTVYLICAGGLVIVLIIIVLLASVFKGRGALKATKSRLEAQQSAYAVLSETKEDLTNILKNFSKEEIGALIKSNYTEQADEIIKEVTDKIVDKLKIDDNTISEVLGNEKVLVEQVKKLSEALIAIASNNRDVAIKVLAEVPTQETVNAMALENAKLKTALGEKAVAETLKK